MGNDANVLILAIGLIGLFMVSCGKKQQNLSIKTTGKDSFSLSSASMAIDTVTTGHGKVQATPRVLPFITEKGVGNLKVGASIEDDGNIFPSCNCANFEPSKEEITKCRLQKTFYDKVQVIKSYFDVGELYYCFYQGSELMVAATGGSEINRILVYSPFLKLKKGIHTGMSAEELVRKYKARIKYTFGPEGSSMVFQVPGVPSNITLWAAYDGTSAKPDQDSSIYLSPSQVKNGRLAIIIIERKYGYDK